MQNSKTDHRWLCARPALAACVPLACLFFGALTAQADDADDLAKQLANPVAALISVPIQANFDDNYGADDRGNVLRINVQPVVPFEIGDDWNLISRTVVPIVEQNDFPASAQNTFGLGDTVQSLFFSPKVPSSNGWTVGVGPAILIPTATDSSLGADSWGLGPTGVALKQSGPWTYGALANHIEDLGGVSDTEVSQTFLQPFLAYVTPSQMTIALNTESVYDWESEQWSVPVNLNVLQLVRAGGQAMQVGLGVRYWLEGPEGGPEGWGLRASFTLLFPR